MSRQKIIAGNWKMYKTINEAEKFVVDLMSIPKPKVEVYLSVAYTLIAPLVSKLKNSFIHIGAQNMHDKEEGAFTGEVSARMLKDIKADFVILGHSERRKLFFEDDAFINNKMKMAVKENIQPILCLGETEEERDLDKTKKVLERQLQIGLKGLYSSELNNLIIAYEPVWAIGTGKTATPEIAEQAHGFIRECIAQLFEQDFAENISILYGGSVKEGNISSLMQQKDIDGALVGNASLQVDSFIKIIQNSER